MRIHGNHKKIYLNVPELVKNFQRKLKTEKSAYAEDVEDFLRNLSKSY